MLPSYLVLLLSSHFLRTQTLSLNPKPVLLYDTRKIISMGREVQMGAQRKSHSLSLSGNIIKKGSFPQGSRQLAMKELV